MHAGSVLAIEPNVSVLPSALLSNVELSTIQVAYDVADIQLLLVDHREFRISSPTSGTIIDTKGIWS